VGAIVFTVLRGRVLGPGGDVVVMVMGRGVLVLVRIAKLGWGGGFMVGMGWKLTENGKEQ
jgi:hypothetical protein